MKKTLFALTLVMLSTAFSVSNAASAPKRTAPAKMMSCYVGVYKASDLVKEDPAVNAASTVALTIPIVDGSADQDFQVNGETVNVVLDKKEYADVYAATFILTTPVADRIKGTSLVAITEDYLVNDGPAKENGWFPPHAKAADVYAYLNRQSGTFALAPKTVNAMKAAGKWGVPNQFYTSQVDMNSAYAVREFVIEQLATKKMQPDDVVGLATMFSCVLEK